MRQACHRGVVKACSGADQSATIIQNMSNASLLISRHRTDSAATVSSAKAALLEFACGARQCAPPPVGKGGSLPGGVKGRIVTNSGAARAVVHAGTGIANVPKELASKFMRSLSGRGADGKPNTEFLDLGKVNFRGGVHFSPGYKQRLIRDDMPQIPPAKRQQFLSDLAAGRLPGLEGKKVGNHEETISPLRTKPVQADMDARKVASMLKTIEDDPLGPEHAWREMSGKDGKQHIIMSKDGKILDGHHRWAAAMIYAQTHPEFKIPVTVVEANMGRVKFGGEGTRGKGPREGLHMREITGGSGLIRAASEFTLREKVANQPARSTVRTDTLGK